MLFTRDKGLKCIINSQIVCFSLKLPVLNTVILLAAPDVREELDPHTSPVTIDSSDFNGSLRQGKDDNDTNCWTSPSGERFMIRGKNYLKDNSKVS